MLTIITLDERIAEAVSRARDRAAVAAVAKAARLDAQIAAWKVEYKARLIITFGAELLSLLDPRFVVGDAELWRIRARFAHGAHVYELSETVRRDQLELTRCDNTVFDAALDPEAPTELANLHTTVLIGAETVDERSDLLLCALAELAARPDVLLADD